MRFVTQKLTHRAKDEYHSEKQNLQRADLLKIELNAGVCCNNSRPMTTAPFGDCVGCYSPLYSYNVVKPVITALSGDCVGWCSPLYSCNVVKLVTTAPSGDCVGWYSPLYSYTL